MNVSYIIELPAKQAQKFKDTIDNAKEILSLYETTDKPFYEVDTGENEFNSRYVMHTYEKQVIITAKTREDGAFNSALETAANEIGKSWVIFCRELDNVPNHKLILRTNIGYTLSRNSESQDVIITSQLKGRTVPINGGKVDIMGCR